MKEIKDLIYSSELELEKYSQGTNIVGNRPHYPMLLLFNSAFDTNAYNSIFSKLGRVWPQSLQHLVKYRYFLRNEQVEYADFENDDIQTEETVLAAVDTEQQEHNTFASMMQMLIFNVLDTSTLESVKDFQSHYEYVEHVKNLVGGKNKTMLVVLLNDSLTNRKISNDIREFLSKNNAYDSVVLISNRTRSNEIFAIPDLYRIVSDIIVLSNNDAVSSVDDEDYKSRFATLYNNTTYTLSYVLCEKPNQKIAIQINDIVLDHALDYLKRTQINELSVWNKKLGIDENGRSQICEKFISSLHIGVDQDVLKRIPVKEIVVIKSIDYLSCSYKRFCEYSYKDVISNFAEDYCKNYILNELDLRSCVADFEKLVRSNVSPAELVELDDTTLERIMGMVNMGLGSLNEELPLSEYIKRQIETHIREKHIYPQFRAVIKRLRDNSKEVISIIEKVQSKYKNYIPLNNDGLGVTYKNLTENYFQTQAGNESLISICNPGNGIDDIFFELKRCFVEIIKTNKSVFSLPFIEEWEKRLDLTGDRIYREISQTLTKGADDLVRLYGNLPVNKILTVYMLHTVDMDGKNPTQLFEHLKETFKNDNIVQYFNTGFDDALEAISLIPCNGSNLLI